MARNYDLIVVGAGLYGAVITQQAVACSRRVLVLEKRNHVAGYCDSYRDEQTGLVVHRYGAHIFHTKQKRIWNYVQQFARFAPYVHRVRAKIDGATYPLPINLNTIRDFLGVHVNAAEVDAFLHSQGGEFGKPDNFEEKAINLVGRRLYEGFVRDYSAKQWGVPPSTLPVKTRLRMEIRPSTDDRYFGECYQGVPIEGYTPMIERMLKGADVELGVDFCDDGSGWRKKAKVIVYSGPLDRYFRYRHGPLKWREIRHELKVCGPESRLEAPVMNINDGSSDCTRVADYSQISQATYKHMGQIILGHERITAVEDNESAYNENRVLKPVRFFDEEDRIKRYQYETTGEHNVYFGGRMADYQLYDMDHVIAHALKTSRQIVERTKPESNLPGD